jgi:hypothetical protein
MKTKFFILPVFMLFISGIAQGQGFVPPAEGKAVVYFTRVSGYGFAVSFEFFHQDKFIGDFSGQNYMRYECDPGEQLFWASSENKEFLTSELETGETYIVIVDVIMGFWKAHVGLSPISIQDEDLFSRAKKLISKQPPVVFLDSQIEKKNKKLAEFIPKELNAYEKSKNDHDFKHISPEMAIPVDAMH